MTPLKIPTDSPLTTESVTAEIVNTAYQAAIVYALVGFVAFVLEIVLAWQNQKWQLYSMAAISFLQTAFTVGIIRQPLKTQPEKAVKWILQISMTTTILFAILLQGIGGTFGLGTSLAIFTITPRILKQRDVYQVMLASVVISLMAGLIDLLAPSTQLVFPLLRNYIILCILVVVVIYVFWFMKRFSTYSMPIKLTAVFLIISLIPVGLMGVATMYFTQTAVSEQITEEIQEGASRTADSLDISLNLILTTIQAESLSPTLSMFLSLSPEERTGPYSETAVLRTLLQLKNQKDTPYLQDYSLLDSQGTIILSTVSSLVGSIQAEQNFFRTPLVTQRPYLSPVQQWSTIPVATASGTYRLPNMVLHFSAPVEDPNGNVIGVLHASYTADYLQNYLQERLQYLKDEHGFAILLDDHQIILANGLFPESRFKPIISLSQQEISTLQANGRLPYLPLSEINVNNSTLASDFNRFVQGENFQFQFAVQSDDSYYANLASLKTQPWSLILAIPTAELTANSRAQVPRLFFMVVAISTVLAGAAFLSGQRVATPLIELSQMVQRFTNGDLSARVHVHYKQDETGLLAHQFNLLAGQIEQLLHSQTSYTKELEGEVSERQRAERELRNYQDHLEDQVEGRTAELKQINERLQRELAERKRAEEAFRASEVRYKMLFDNAPVAIFTKDRQGRYTSANADTLTYWNTNPVGFMDSDLLPPNIAVPLRQADLLVMSTGEEVVLEEVVEVKGQKVTILSRKVPLRDADGDINGILGISVNISPIKEAELKLQEANERLQEELLERQKAEEALRSSELQYQALFEAAPVAIYTKDRDGRYTSANADTLTYWSTNPVGHTDMELLPPHIGIPLRQADLHVMETGQELVIEEVVEVQGKKITVLSRKVALRNPNHEVTGILGISVNITERKEAEQMLQEAKEAAESANRAKSAFLANMSHELRTPLNVIIGYSEMLQDEAHDMNLPGLLPDLQRIKTAGSHLLELISQVLDLSKIEAGRMTLYVEEFYLQPVVDELTATILPVIQKEGNVLEVYCAEDIGSISTDLTKTKQILMNLLSNAAKFTKNGRITLKVWRESYHSLSTDMIHIEVADTGIGMTSEQMKTLFQPFVQGDVSTTRKYGGTGLGLAITQRFCEMMGGNISISSTLGEGSTFHVQLPATVRE